MVEKEMTRRRFLVAASGAAAAAVLAGCLRKEEIDTISAVVQEATATTAAADAPAAEATANPTATTVSPTVTAVPVQQNVRFGMSAGFDQRPLPWKMQTLCR